MTIQPGFDNHIVLCGDGMIFDLLDVLIFQDDMKTTIDKVSDEHGTIIRAVPTPYKLFDEILGLKKTGEFVRIGPTNWPNLFMIRGEFQYYLAYMNLDGERRLVANSDEGISWHYNVIEA